MWTAFSAGRTSSTQPRSASVDVNRHKQGLYTPGSRLQVCPPERLLEDQPDYVLLLAWNYADEILTANDEYQRRGGTFVIPIPEPRTVEFAR
jgi:hypothetical protein